MRQVKYCENCKKELPEEFTFCPTCGCKTEDKLLPNLCPKCGNEVADEANFCSNCGNSLKQEESSYDKSEKTKTDFFDLPKNSTNNNEKTPFIATPVTYPRRMSGGRIAAMVFMIISCIYTAIMSILFFALPSMGHGIQYVAGFLTLLSLCWQIPMTAHVYTATKGGEVLGVGFDICVLLFVSTIAGIILLCSKEE